MVFQRILGIRYPRITPVYILYMRHCTACGKNCGTFTSRIKYSPIIIAKIYPNLIKFRSTEEYPHLRPARLRRGFIHRGIMVL